MYVQTYCLV